jgi:Flp pilus assembly protein TadD
MINRGFGRMLAALTAAGLLLGSGGAQAALFGHHKPEPGSQLSDSDATNIQRMIEEQRYVDAAQLLNEAVVVGVHDPRLSLLIGKLELARGHAESALVQFKEVETTTTVRAAALEGEGIALSSLGRSEDAMNILKEAVAQDPSAWRAWNALAAEYDNRHDWAQAAEAYDHAMADSNGSAIVLNNRGYSRMLQNRLDDATADFVAALARRPDLAAARSNLRFVLAIKGQYQRATTGGDLDDQAAILNNAGFAAIVRGDYVQAEQLLNGAIAARGQFYDRASANLTLAHNLSQKLKTPTADTPSDHGRN